MKAPSASGAPALFDGQAAEFDRRTGLPESDCRAIAAAVLAMAEARPGDRVVEIGAGTGMIGRWFPDLGARYIGIDLSRGMLEVFRHRLEAAGASHIGLVQADGARSWPLPAGAARIVFSSRAMHLLPLEHAAAEARRVAAGGVCILGRVERRPEGVQARMARRMRELVRESGLAPRSGGGRALLDAWRREGAAELPPTVVARWTARTSPSQALARWRGKEGLAGTVLPPGAQDEVLAEVAAWAAAEAFGDLDAVGESEEAYVLEGVHIQSW